LSIFLLEFLKHPEKYGFEGERVDERSKASPVLGFSDVETVKLDLNETSYSFVNVGLQER
jgi:hypothetical protein